MNEEIFKGLWQQIRGRAKQWWGVLTDDDLDQIDGRLDQLIGKLQEKYGFTADQARRDVEDRVAQLQRAQIMSH